MEIAHPSCSVPKAAPNSNLEVMLNNTELNSYAVFSELLCATSITCWAVEAENK